MDMETDSVIQMSGRSAEPFSSEGAQTSSAQQARSVRHSTPEFALRPSPDVPPWLQKCFKLLASNNPHEAQEELGRMWEEAAEKRDRQAQEEAAASGSGTNTSKKTEVRIAGANKIAPLPAKPSASPSAAASATVPKLKTQTSVDKPKAVPPVKRMRSPSPPILTLDDLPDNGATAAFPEIVLDDVSDGMTGMALFKDDVCSVCGKSNVLSGNKLLKCFSCDEKYHQLCHTPTVTNIDPDDPRAIWYCNKCKDKTSKPTEPKSSSTHAGSKSKSSAKAAVPSSSPSQAAASLFQRNKDSKPGPSGATPSAGGASAGLGLAALAKQKAQASSVAAKRDAQPQKRARLQLIDSSKLPPMAPKNV
ncbi:hypothetical protein BV898_10121 [Hypsibius exemplaris]|uniref:Integrator complex subunit 12 n=1 Tax=Hypsibius exemplaris TaxID=2072580 RepID=A0A1W0WKJ6_HYPEX|nr:hypothetical protein BV898_10121 [Hypsibius exemplaris]